VIASDKVLVVVGPDTAFPLLVYSLIAGDYSTPPGSADNP